MSLDPSPQATGHSVDYHDIPSRLILRHGKNPALRFEKVNASP